MADSFQQRGERARQALRVAASTNLALNGGYLAAIGWISVLDPGQNLGNSSMLWVQQMLELGHAITLGLLLTTLAVAIAAILVRAPRQLTFILTAVPIVLALLADQLVYRNMLLVEQELDARRAEVVIQPLTGKMGFSGRIGHATPMQLKTLASGHEIHTLVITSAGGEVDAALQMMDWVERDQLRVVALGQCDSACAYIWLAANRRAIAGKTPIGVHGVSAPFGDESERSRAERALLTRLGRLESISPSAARAMLAVPSAVTCRLAPSAVKQLGIEFEQLPRPRAHAPSNCQVMGDAVRGWHLKITN